MACGIIAPRQDEMVGVRTDHYLAECILASRNHDLHVIKTPEGKYFSWEDDLECGCCAPDEDDRCTSFREITEQEAISLGAPST